MPRFSVIGKLVDNCNKDCLFTAEYHSGQLALRDRNGQYLSPIGSKAVLKTRSNTVTKDELFSLEDSLPQASFVAALNNRFVSVKQGKIVKYNYFKNCIKLCIKLIKQCIKSSELAKKSLELLNDVRINIVFCLLYTGYTVFMCLGTLLIKLDIPLRNRDNCIFKVLPFSWCKYTTFHIYFEIIPDMFHRIQVRTFWWTFHNWYTNLTKFIEYLRNHVRPSLSLHK